MSDSPPRSEAAGGEVEPVYALYLESGPRRRKTMVHVLDPDLFGCVALGPTTEAALAATPDAIRAYRRFLRRHGEPPARGGDVEAPFQTRVVEHVTEGDWLGNGSPYLVFTPDLDPLSAPETEAYLRRFAWLRQDLADWAEDRTAAELDAAPAGGGRSARAILLHVLGPTGSYLSVSLGGMPGFSALHTAAERGTIGLPEALRRSATMVIGRVSAATPEQRAAVHQHLKGARTLRKGMRRLLEHDWEHLAELARRPDGPRFD